MQRFSRLFLVLVFLLSITLSTSGCRNNAPPYTSNITPQQPETDLGVPSTTDPSSPDAPNPAPIKPSPILIESTPFSNGRAWIEYTIDHIDYLASIDKNGKEIFKIEKDGIAGYDYYNEEYAYLHMTNHDLVLINKNGDSLYTITETDTNTVLAYGGGYTLCKRHEESFDSSHDFYEIYDPTGNIHQIDIGGKFGSANYCGMGVFGISLKGPWDWNVTFYSAENRQWIVSAEDEVIGDINIRFENGIGCIGIEYYDPDDTGYRSALFFATTDGEWYATPLSFGWNFNHYGVAYHNGVVVLYDLKEEIYCYDPENGTYTQLDETYAKKALAGNFTDRSGFYSKETGFRNDRFILEMKGKDSEYYFSIFDKQWNVILEPTAYDSIIGFDGYRLVFTRNGETFVYDQNGKELFCASDLNADAISAYSDGVSQLGIGLYIDPDGNYLFEEIVYLP